MDHSYGKFESIKFDHLRESYREYTRFLEQSEYTKTEIIENAGAFVGDLALNRILTLTEYFKMTETLAGHIADVGTYKGASLLLFAKLLKIRSAQSLWQAHGFDWFKGTPKLSDQDTDLVKEGGYKAPKEDLLKLIRQQDLHPIARVHDLDLRTELSAFMDKHPHLQFRMIFMDAGVYEVMDVSIPEFWNRLVPGGLMVFDQLSHELAPGEIAAVRKHLPNCPLRTLPNSWMPNAYVLKE